MSHETQWTPGPWSHGGYIGHSGFSVNAMNFGCVAERWEDAEYCDDKRRAVMAANARLIAAAPEMAALLERNQNVIMDALTSGHDITPAIADDMRAVLAEARALLATIKGAENPAALR